MLWDDDNLYVGIFSRDTDIWASLTERDDTLWEEEVVELYLDPQRTGSDYLELQFNPLGAVFDALFPSPRNRVWEQAAQHTVEGMEVAVHVNGSVDNRDDRDRSWSVEVRIPLTSLPGLANTPPRNGDQIRANFYRYDRNGATPEAPDSGTTVTAAWSPVGGGTFHNPERFGLATFRGNPRRTTPTPTDQGTERPTPVQPTLQVQPLRVPGGPGR